MTNMEGCTVIITGGANGIGEATAHRFAKAGATVVIFDFDAERTPLVESEIRKDGGSVSTFVIDVREEEQIVPALERVRSDLGRIDVVHNNVASLELAPGDVAIADLQPQLLLDVLRSDLYPYFLMTKHVLPAMLEKGSGSIINMASVSGMAGERTLTAYGIAKAGVIQLTRATAAQYSKQGIRCNAIAPAYVTTRNNAKYAPPRLRSMYERNMLTAHTTSPEDIASLVLYLGSDESARITGHVIPVDGGITVSSPIVADYRDWQGTDEYHAAAWGTAALAADPD